MLYPRSQFNKSLHNHSVGKMVGTATANDEKFEKEWLGDYEQFMYQSRKTQLDKDKEFEKQQELYSKYAETYEKAVSLEAYSGPVKIAAKINSMFPDNKDIKILDYGCGTGLAADHLSNFGFKNVDGLDPNKDLLDAARKKKVMQNLYQLRSDGSHEEILENTYNVICSTGVFFLSSSHPGFECVRELCRIIKPGGYLIILTNDKYLSFDYVDHTIIETLEKKGVVKIFPKELQDSYRKTLDYDDGQESTAAILRYQKC